MVRAIHLCLLLLLGGLSLLVPGNGAAVAASKAVSTPPRRLTGAYSLDLIYPHYRRLRQEMERWLAQSVRLDPPSQGGGADEANYALAWVPHYLVTGSEATRAHFETLLGLLETWTKRDCTHGYQPREEAHHGPEPFLLFLPRYLGLFPKEARARLLLEDAAHHIGNWVEGVPDWFDYGGNRFHSYYLGTRFVSDEPQFAVELAEHFRFLHIALAAYRVTGEPRYREWAERYGRRRAQMLVDVPSGPLPLLWDTQGRPRWTSDCPRTWLAISGSGHHAPGDPLAGVEVLLASGAIYALGDLYQLTGDRTYRDASRRIVEPLIPSLADPYGDPGAAALAYYRRAFQDTSLDPKLLAAVRQFPPAEKGEQAMVLREKQERTEPGIGRRSDMLYWGVREENGSVRPTREPSAAALTLAYQLTGDLGFAQRALQLAATRLAMARRILRGGREHTDMGGAICSVAQGHGRDWGIGAVTGCYGTLCLGTWEVLGASEPAIRVRQENGRVALPESVVCLVSPPGPGTGLARFYNAGKTTETLGVAVHGDKDWRSISLAPGGSTEISLPSASIPGATAERR